MKKSDEYLYMSKIICIFAHKMTKTFTDNLNEREHNK